MNTLGDWYIFINPYNNKGILFWTGIVRSINNSNESIYIEFEYDYNTKYLNLVDYEIINTKLYSDDVFKYINDKLGKELFNINILNYESTKDINVVAKLPYGYDKYLKERYRYKMKNDETIEDNLFKGHKNEYYILKEKKVDLKNDPDVIENYLIYINKNNKGMVNLFYLQKILEDIFNELVNINEFNKLVNTLDNVYFTFFGNVSINDITKSIEERYYRDLILLTEDPYNTRYFANYVFSKINTDKDIVIDHIIELDKNELHSKYIPKDNIFILKEIINEDGSKYKFIYDKNNKVMKINIEPNNYSLIYKYYNNIISYLLDYKDGIVDKKTVMEYINYIMDAFKSLIELNNKGKDIFNDLNELLKLNASIVYRDKPDYIIDKYKEIIDSMNIYNYKNKEINGQFDKVSKKDLEILRNDIIEGYKLTLSEHFKHIKC